MLRRKRALCLLLLGMNGCSSGGEHVPDTASNNGGSAGSAGAGGGGALGGDGALAGSGHVPGGGASGSGGSASGASGGGAGGSANPLSAPCGTERSLLDLAGDVATLCTADAAEYDIPNADRVGVTDLKLPIPAQAGKPYTISFNAAGSPNVNIELWGTNEACGKAAELLWWGAANTGQQCLSFVPSASYTHLLYVTRLLDKEMSRGQLASMAFCPTAACPGSTTGTARQLGDTIEAPLGVLDLDGGGSLATNYYEWTSYPLAHILLFPGDIVPDGETKSFELGLFRLNPSDPYGDAWYCAGQGSTIEPSGGGYDLTLNNITRLGDCTAASGSAIASFSTENQKGSITSSIDFFAATALREEDKCFDAHCLFGLDSADKSVWLDVSTRANVGSYFAPTLQKVDVQLAALIGYDRASNQLQMSCSNSGTTFYAPKGKSSVDLEKLSVAAACPGTAVTRNSFSMRIE